MSDSVGKPDKWLVIDELVSVSVCPAVAAVGWYAASLCFDPDEGAFPMALQWVGSEWAEQKPAMSQRAQYWPGRVFKTEDEAYGFADEYLAF